MRVQLHTARCSVGDRGAAPGVQLLWSLLVYACRPNTCRHSVLRLSWQLVRQALRHLRLRRVSNKYQFSCFITSVTRCSAAAEIARVVSHKPYIAQNYIDFLGYIFVADNMGLASVNFTQLASNVVVLCEIMRNDLTAIGPFKVTKVTDFGTDCLQQAVWNETAHLFFCHRHCVCSNDVDALRNHCSNIVSSSWPTSVAQSAVCSVSLSPNSLSPCWFVAQLSGDLGPKC